MKDKTQALKKQGAEVGLKINATKTKLMPICNKRGNGVSIEGEQVEEVDKFTHLRSIVSKEVLMRTSRHALGRQGTHSRC